VAVVAVAPLEQAVEKMLAQLVHQIQVEVEVVVLQIPLTAALVVKVVVVLLLYPT
jgi:hypothetical protein